VSEDELQRELHVPVLLYVVDIRKQPTASCLDKVRWVIRDVIGAAGDKQVRVIEEIEEFGAELQPYCLFNRDVAEETNVPVLLPRRAECVSSECPRERPVD